MSALLPAGALISVRLTVQLPVAATPEDVSTWLAVELSCWPPELVADNPLRDAEVMAFAPDDLKWSDTGQQGRVIEDAGPRGQLWPDLYVREDRR